jgi:transposase
MPGPECSICRHGNRREIESQLANGVSSRAISRQFGVSKDTVSRHKKNCIPLALEAVREQIETKHALNLNNELTRLFLRMNRLFDACEDWLADPDDGAKYTLDARSDEIDVIYEEEDGEYNDGRPKIVRKRASLGVLLMRAERGIGITVLSTESKHADPRQLIINTASQLGKQIEILGKLTGEFKQDGKNPEDAESERQYWQAQVRDLARKYNKSEQEVAADLARENPTVQRYIH